MLDMRLWQICVIRDSSEKWKASSSICGKLPLVTGQTKNGGWQLPSSCD